MAVQCAKCGEELMGAVNRCWRCGQLFVAHGSDPHLPPVRRSPVVVATAEVWDAEVADPNAGPPTPVTIARGEAKVRQANAMRRGSPFQDRGTATFVAPGAEPPPNARGRAIDRATDDQRNGGATASAILTGPLGLISLIAAFLFPLAGVLLALLGMALGVWGINSRRRRIAVAGLLLCCLSLAAATFNGVVEVYVARYGAAPWTTRPVVP